MTHKKSVGSILRETRLSKNISLKLIASDLKISLDILEDIENDIIPEYLNKVYITGHVRAYANYLNIDSDNLIKYFKNQILFNDKNILKEFPKPLSNNNFLFFSKGTSIVSFVFITVAFYFFFIRPSDLQPDYSITPDLTQEMISEIESIDLDSFIADEYDIDNENSPHANKVTAVPSFFVYTDGDLQPKKHFQGDLDKVETLVNRLAHRLHTGEI